MDLNWCPLNNVVVGEVFAPCGCGLEISSLAKPFAQRSTLLHSMPLVLYKQLSKFGDFLLTPKVFSSHQTIQITKFISIR
jgi:hypothetical protein